MGKPLTVELILAKTKTDNLFSLKNLNLWGNDLDDLKLLRQMPNLEVVSLSVNKITTIKEFSNCSKLQELYLRKNNIQDLSEIRYLMNNSNLKVLWLCDNPCAETPNYREIVIKSLPDLIKLDNQNITKEEKFSAEKLNFNFSEDNDYQEDNYNSNQQQQKFDNYQQQQLKNQYQQQQQQQPSQNYYNNRPSNKKESLKQNFQQNRPQYQQQPQQQQHLQQV